MEVLLHEASSVPEKAKTTQQPPRTVESPPRMIVNEQDSIGNGTPNASHLATFNHGQSSDILFENIRYNVSLGWRKGTKEILHGVSGRLPSKQLIAIMGPSGAGKSTLLDILSGYRLTGISGSVYVNRRIRDLDDFRRTLYDTCRRSSAYLTQDDRLQPLLTVQENMRVSADLKLGTDTSRSKKESIITEILTTLGLQEHLHTRSAQLSGGQKKRMSIALELVNNPSVMFLDEPTTGLDSSSCMQVVNLLKILARQGRTIVCTVHQPSASLFQLFDQVYVLAKGECLYLGAASQLVPYLESVKLPCPMYHNPADYVIELACGEYGEDKIEALVTSTKNGKCVQWLRNCTAMMNSREWKARDPPVQVRKSRHKAAHQATSPLHQLKVLLWRGYIKVLRDSTLTHLRIIVSICTGLMLGAVFMESGSRGSRVLENYNLLFTVLMHHMMTTMMLTILTFPTEMSILKKEHFNRWYSLKMFYTSVSIIDIPVSMLCCLLFTTIIYLMSCQPLELTRFSMFFTISMLVSFVAQSFGLMIGAVFDVVNGTFLGPTISVPIMMFAGFGVSLKDLPYYLKWGSHISYLRYGLEGLIGAIYGLDRKTLACDEGYCHYKYPAKFLSEIGMRGDQFWWDVVALCTILLITRVMAYVLLRWKLVASR